MSQKIIKLPDVMQRCALSRSSLYSYVKAGTFPRPVSLGVRAVGWIEAEISDWISQKAEKRGVTK